MDDVSDLLNVWMETVRDYAIFLVDLGGRVASWNVGAERILGIPGIGDYRAAARDLLHAGGSGAGNAQVGDGRGAVMARASDDRWHLRKDGSQFWCSGLLMSPRRRGLDPRLRQGDARPDRAEANGGATPARAEALQEADRRKNEFLAMLSHELRNPLAPILTSLYVLKGQKAAEGTVVELTRAMIERQVMNLKRLIDDLLDVSRMALNRIQLHREPVDLSVIAVRAVEDVQSLIQERRHELTFTTDPAPLILEGDAVRLEQVILNLLTNAIKFTDPGWQALADDRARRGAGRRPSARHGHRH